MLRRERVKGSFDHIYWPDFANLHNQAHITIPDGTKCINDREFCGQCILHSIQIPESVGFIGWGAFDSCSNLTSIRLPKNISALYEHTFRCCTNLENIILPENLLVIHDEVFQDCKSLKRIYIPDTVTEILTRAFSGCDSLQTVSLPDGVPIRGIAFGIDNLAKSIKIIKRYSSDEYRYQHCRYKSMDILASIKISDDYVNIRDLDLFDTALLGVLCLMEVQGVDDGAYIGIQLVTDFVTVARMLI